MLAVRVRRIELPTTAWKAVVLPLNYTRGKLKFHNPITTDKNFNLQSKSPRRGSYSVVGNNLYFLRNDITSVTRLV